MCKSAAYIADLFSYNIFIYFIKKKYLLIISFLLAYIPVRYRSCTFAHGSVGVLPHKLCHRPTRYADPYSPGLVVLLCSSPCTTSRTQSQILRHDCRPANHDGKKQQMRLPTLESKLKLGRRRSAMAHDSIVPSTFELSSRHMEPSFGISLQSGPRHRAPKLLVPPPDLRSIVAHAASSR